MPLHTGYHKPDLRALTVVPSWVGGKYLVQGLGGGGRTHRLGTVSLRKGGNMIDYDDEDPAIRTLFEEERKKSGVAIQMPQTRKSS